MTLEKVLVPPNFSEVIKLIKNFRGDNPDSILKDLIKIMETNGLNDSNDCKKTSEKIEASNFVTRKKYFQSGYSLLLIFLNSCRCLNALQTPNSA